MLAFDKLLANVDTAAKTYEAVRQAKTAGKTTSTPVVQTQGAAAPIVQQGKPANVKPTAANTKTTEETGPNWLLIGGGIAAAVALAVIVVLVRR
jgi:hypothetical protein